jgi:hypothetical protein
MAANVTSRLQGLAPPVTRTISVSLIKSLISAATKQVQDITRQSDEEFMANEEKNLIRIRVAILYTVAFLYEHREEADHHALNMTLRSLLFGTRKEGF